jgi:gas vesicle protein
MSRRGLGDLLLGVGIGLGIGLLVSPNTGEENRKILKKKGAELIDKAKNVDLNEVKDKLVDEFYNLKEQVQDMDLEKAKKIASKKGQEIKEKADELLALAKEKAEPKVEKTVKDLKKNLSDFLQNLSDRLED